MIATHATSSIIVTDPDNERLSALAAGRMSSCTEASNMLALELEHASIVDQKNIPSNIVTMNSCVSVRDEGTGTTRTYTLVYPSDEDISVGNLSILTPAGVALIGLAEGETSVWIARDGQTKALTVVEILYQPEANGRWDL